MYGTLKGTGKVVEFIGLLVCAASFCFLLYGLASAVENRWPAGAIIASLIPTLIGVGAGILIMIQGQQILCFVGIEENTRKTYVAVQNLVSWVTERKVENTRQALFAGLELREPEVEAHHSKAASNAGAQTASEPTTRSSAADRLDRELAVLQKRVYPAPALAVAPGGGIESGAETTEHEQTTCPSCLKVFGGDLHGQYCEECGTLL